MSYFLYRAIRGPNDVLEGSIEALSERSAVNKLTSYGYYPVWIREVSSACPRAKKIRPASLIDFTRQLAELLNSGLTLFDSLVVIEGETQDTVFKEIVIKIKSGIKEGNTFSGSLSAFPNIFSSLYINLVRSGETGGMLNGALSDISNLLEKKEALKAKVVNALVYPALMVVVGIATILILMIFVIPKLAGVFAEMGGTLPFPTRVLIGSSGFVKDYWILLAVFAAGILLLIKRSEKNKIVKGAMDRLKLRIPLIGRILRDIEIERFSRSLSALLMNGVPMLRALGVIAGAINNRDIRSDLDIVYKEVASGGSLSSALKKSRYFPQYVVTMAAIGEEGGFLDKTLSKVAQRYESENDRVVKRLSSLLEPVMILAIGLGVGFIVISMLLPVFEISMSVH